jgi:hypothetical protein
MPEKKAWTFYFCPKRTLKKANTATKTKSIPGSRNVFFSLGISFGGFLVLVVVVCRTRELGSSYIIIYYHLDLLVKMLAVVTANRSLARFLLKGGAPKSLVAVRFKSSVPKKEGDV